MFLIGRKNYESSKNYLPLSKALVITRDLNYTCESRVFTDINEAISFAKECEETELFVLGGEQIYKELLHKADYLYLSIIDYHSPGDTYFPEHEHLNWVVLEERFQAKDEQTPFAVALSKT